MRVVTIEVCVGSSCYLRGAPSVIARFQELVGDGHSTEVVLKGSFCMERCTDGVSVRIGERVFSGVHPGDVPQLYERYVRPAIARPDASSGGDEVSE
jgi:NADH:ubiquinone oxidoreductase subunit E